MTLAQFRSCVAAYMQRSESTFVYDGVNLLTQAANMARQYVERTRNFEMCKTSAQITSVDITNGALLSSMVLRGTVTPVVAKSISAAFLGFSTSTGEFPIEMMTREAHIARLSRQYDRMVTRNPQQNSPAEMMGFFSLVRHGDYIYIHPGDITALGSQTVTVYFDIVKWLPEYVADSDTDFLLTYGRDYMLFKTIQMLNFMIKEDQRVPVSTAMLQEAYNSIVSWDSTMITNSVNDNELD